MRHRSNADSAWEVGRPVRHVADFSCQTIGIPEQDLLGHVAELGTVMNLTLPFQLLKGTNGVVSTSYAPCLETKCAKLKAWPVVSN